MDLELDCSEDSASPYRRSCCENVECYLSFALFEWVWREKFRGSDMHTDSWIALILAYVAFVLYGLLQWDKHTKTTVRERVKVLSFQKGNLC